MGKFPKLSMAANAAVHIAKKLGLTDPEPHILHQSSHTSIHLRPYPVVARVRSDVQDSNYRVRLAREIEVCRYLKRRGGPAVTPANGIDAGPHFYGEFGLSFWEFVEHRAASEEDWPAAISAYKALNQCLAEYPGHLPCFTETISECREMLLRDNRLPGLHGDEQEFLKTISENLLVSIGQMDFPAVPLHGDTHLGNVLMTPRGPLWGDLENAGLGPLEWDLTSFPMPLDNDWRFDHQLFKILSTLRSFCVVVWCADFENRNTVQQEALTYHLGLLRG